MYQSWKEKTTTINYINGIRNLVKEYDSNVYLFDAYTKLRFDEFNRNIYFGTNDNTHPVLTGVKLYAYELGKYIESIN